MDWKFENRKWLYPGIGLKRWIFLLVISFVLISAGIAVLVDYQLISHLENIILDFFSPLIRGDVSYWFDLIVALVLIVSGLLGINYSLKGAFKGIYQLELHDNVVDRLYEKNVLQKGPRVVALGGGTGLSNLLRGLKKYSSNLTAIVTVADDGGSSGKLRDELGMLPPGDIRNCLVALADAEPLMQDLFQHRFESEGPLEGHSFGNLFIASLTEVLGDFEDAVKESSKVLAIRGKVLPATNEDIHLGAV
ncbi:MAG: gluconeogenesis factor YvcK family protein, partial [bacterium]